jgi:subtilisin family serine protease
MKTLLTLLIVSGIAFAGTITPELRDAIAETGQGQLLRVLVKPVGMVDTGYIDRAAAGMDRDARRDFAAEVMQEHAAEAQEGILAELATFDLTAVQDIHPYWILNAISVSLSPEAILDIASRDDVLYVRLMNAADILIEPEDARAPLRAELTDGNAWGVDKIEAPAVWAMGYEGSGIIVSVVDTGVNYNHLDLQSNMWHDTAAGYHYGWDFADGDADPMDTAGHGTHCAGSVASDGTAGTVCGVAPSATIMALRVGTTFSDEQDVWDAFQFSIVHGADVISTSLGWPQAQGPDRQTWREVENNVLAAGICHSIAAGNEGGSPSDPGDIRTPGDVPPPWLHPNQTTSGGLSAVVTVGATDSADNIASFSSRGYSTWETQGPWFDYPDTAPAIGLIDPDISGPGVDILSCNYANPSGYATMSGTSMATPHLAGCMALLLDVNPSLSPAQVDMLLETTALDRGAAGKDNEYGAGRVQIYDAVLAAIALGTAGSGTAVPASGVVISSTGANPVTSAVRFDLYTGSWAEMDLSVFDLSGRRVAVIHDGQMDQGNHSFTWSVPESFGDGIYFIRAASPEGSATARFTLLKSGTVY